MNEDIVAPQCASCMNRFVGETEKCRAFPDGIPTSILETRRDHRKRVLGDHGFRYMPNSNAPPDEFWNLIFEDESVLAASSDTL